MVAVLLNTLEQVCPLQISFQSPDGINKHSRLVDKFVDDAALGLTDDGSMSYDELVGSVEDVAQTWEKLLH